MMCSERVHYNHGWECEECRVIVDGLMALAVGVVAQTTVVSCVNTPCSLRDVEENILESSLEEIGVGTDHREQAAFGQCQSSSEGDRILFGYPKLVEPLVAHRGIHSA